MDSIQSIKLIDLSLGSPYILIHLLTLVGPALYPAIANTIDPL